MHERRVTGTDWRAESGHACDGACNNPTPVHVRVSVLRKMVPADHVRECVAAVGLRVERVMALEKSPVGKSDRFEIFLTKYHGLPQ